MKTKVQKQISTSAGVLVAPVFKEEINKLPAYAAPIKGFIGKRVKAKDFKGKKDQMISTYIDMKKMPELLVVLGCGEKKKLDGKTAREIGARLGKMMKEKKQVQLTFLMNDRIAKYAQEFVEGIKMSQHSIDKYKTCKKNSCPKYELERLNIVMKKPNKEVEEALKKADLIAEGMKYVKDLVNSPSNEVHAELFEKEAKRIAKKNGYKFTSIKQKELQKKGWGGLLAVNQGAKNEAKCVVLQYNGAKSKKDAPIVIVGKGVIFDTGGYNLKPTRYIETMHQDMAGAATVMGLFDILKKAKVKKNVVGIIPLAENLVSAKAYRPSDIITMLSGLTVEITNTDAEGRLILADGITHATKMNPESILTIATLTGAVSVALGNRYSGLMGNDKKLVGALQKAGDETDDLGWELPIHEDFKKSLDSKLADAKNCNITSRGAGSQEGGAFLERFVEKNKWCHIDIGGTAFTEAPKPYEKAGATSSGLRMLLQFLENSEK